MIKRHNYWHDIIKIVAFSLFFFAMLCCSFSVKMGCIYGRGTSSILVASYAHCVGSFYMWEIKKKRASFSSRKTLLSQKPISKIYDNEFLRNNQEKI